MKKWLPEMLIGLMLALLCFAAVAIVQGNM